MMLSHIGQPEVAERIHNAWLSTIEQGLHTQDIYNPNISKKCLGTKDFTKAIISNLVKNTEKFQPVHYSKTEGSMKDWRPKLSQLTPMNKQIVGVDIFLHWNPSIGTPDDLAKIVQPLDGVSS